MDYQKVPQEINNIVEDNVKMLEQLFPSAVKDGQVDFEALKEELGQFEEVGKEKYELTWAGKQDAKKKAQEDVYNRTLKYIEADSKNPETTENLYIEGDNLEVLKLLRQNYYGAIKMIYIDPPYNTGRDFVYSDKFNLNARESDIAEGIKSNDGELLQANPKSSNKFHAKWISMIYSRLKIAKELLSDDGVLFISIDDNEMENLKVICNEIFGDSNFVGCAGRITKKSNNKGDFWAPNFDYILTYTKNRFMAQEFTGGANEDSYNLIETDGPRKGEKYQLVRLYMSSIQNRNPEQRFWIDCPDGSKIIPPGTTFPPERPNLGDGIWRWSRSTFEANMDKIVVKEVRSSNLLNENHNPAKWNVFTKTYLNDVLENSSAKPNSFIEDYINQMASHELNDIDIPFDYAKPTGLIQYLMKVAQIKSDDIILDFFSGSASTAHAVMKSNAEDGGNRKFIMIQLPEETDEKSEAYKAGYKNICEIGKERIRRAGEKIKEEVESTNAQLKIGEEPKQVPDIGFKVFRTADTNIKWNLYDELGQFDTSTMTYTPDLADFTIGFKDIDVVYEVMLRQKDVPLSSTLETLTDIGKRTYLYGSTYLVCLETEITEELIDKLAALDPLPIKFIFRDSAFKDDINLKDETFRRLKNLIERNSGLEKKTYTVEFI
jgi:adenine-specific DNA-methyltransferase